MPKGNKRKQHCQAVGSDAAKTRHRNAHCTDPCRGEAGEAVAGPSNESLEVAARQRDNSLEADDVELESSSNGTRSSGAHPSGVFDIGDDEVLGVSDDPVGLVGCAFVVEWEGKARRCIVDAYAPDAPSGPAYIISWCGTREEHHLLSCATMANLGAQCSQGVKAKMAGALICNGHER